MSEITVNVVCPICGSQNIEIENPKHIPKSELKKVPAGTILLNWLHCKSCKGVFANICCQTKDLIKL